MCCMLLEASEEIDGDCAGKNEGKGKIEGFRCKATCEEIPKQNNLTY